MHIVTKITIIKLRKIEKKNNIKNYNMWKKIITIISVVKLYRSSARNKRKDKKK